MPLTSLPTASHYHQSRTAPLGTAQPLFGASQVIVQSLMLWPFWLPMVRQWRRT